LNTDMYKFESSQEDESRAQSADASRAYSKLRAFNGCGLCEKYYDRPFHIIWLTATANFVNTIQAVVEGQYN